MIHTLQLHMRKKLFTVSTPPQVFQNRSKTDNGVHDDRPYPTLSASWSRACVHARTGAI